MSDLEKEIEAKGRLDNENARRAAFQRASTQGLVRGALYGLGVGLGATLLGSRFSSSFRALRLPVKSALVSMSVFGGAAFGSEHAVYRLARPATEFSRAERRSENPMQTIMDHRLGIVSSAVAAAVLGTGYRMAQNRNTTGTQKFMNVRLYGQMAGLAAIIALVGLSAARSVVPNGSSDNRKSRPEH